MVFFRDIDKTDVMDIKYSPNNTCLYKLTERQ